MQIKIDTHCMGDKGIVVNGSNISKIMDHLIRLAAKLTERFASDIIYDIADLNTAVKEKTELDFLLFFYENGVVSRKAADFNADTYNGILASVTPIQTWRLTHNPTKTETKLIRIDVRKTL